jgi:hypothetical protein
MGNREELIEKILEAEWDKFQKVQNIGGRATCQDDKKTFDVMRSSQFASWSDEAMESYLGDLQDADKKGRNLLTEKYARMMKSTSPREYARIEGQLPSLEEGVAPLVAKITDIVIGWEEELSREFPHVTARGRPIHSSQDSQFATSKETYLRGELETYSKRTLELYYKGLLEQKSKGINKSRVVLEQMVKQSGYASAEEAEEKLKGS